VLSRHSELLSLPRMKIEDWDGEVFARKLCHWFKG
jgi:hypothetical protein